MHLEFKTLPDVYAVAKLNTILSSQMLESATTRAGKSAALFALSITDQEISLVCPESALPHSAQCAQIQRDWRALRIEGTLDFALVGILARISATLAARGISIFAVSTFNTDYILVSQKSFTEACDALRQDGHTIYT